MYYTASRTKTSVDMFFTEANGNKTRYYDYYAGVLLGSGYVADRHAPACYAYCGKEGFSYAATVEHTANDFDCFCGNAESSACTTANCIGVSFKLY